AGAAGQLEGDGALAVGEDRGRGRCAAALVQALEEHAPGGDGADRAEDAVGRALAADRAAGGGGGDGEEAVAGGRGWGGRAGGATSLRRTRERRSRPRGWAIGMPWAETETRATSGTAPSGPLSTSSTSIAAAATTSISFSCRRAPSAARASAWSW